MTEPGGLLPRTPGDSAKLDDDASSMHVQDDVASHESASSHSVELDTLAGRRRARRKQIRRSFALGLVCYGFVVMAVCLTINIVVGGGGH